MIEMPEAATIARQMDQTLTGKAFKSFERGPLTHKFLWLTKPAEEYNTILSGAPVTGAKSYGRSIYLYVGDQAQVLWFGDLGGRILYHPNEKTLPKKYHLLWDFIDESALSYTLQMWGFVGLLTTEELKAHPYAQVGIPPMSDDFTLERFNHLLEDYPDKAKKGVKAFLVTSKYINGIGNGYLQDILFRAKIHPARKIPSISPDERQSLYIAIQSVMEEAIRLGGRDDERNLFDHPGGYHRLMSNETVGTPCPTCGTAIQKITYLGGACYFCPSCQV